MVGFLAPGKFGIFFLSWVPGQAARFPAKIGCKRILTARPEEPRRRCPVGLIFAVLCFWGLRHKRADDIEEPFSQTERFCILLRLLGFARLALSSANYFWTLRHGNAACRANPPATASDHSSSCVLLRAGLFTGPAYCEHSAAVRNRAAARVEYSYSFDRKGLALHTAWLLARISLDFTLRFKTIFFNPACFNCPFAGGGPPSHPSGHPLLFLFGF